MLEEVRAFADVVVDTSAMTVHELRSFIQKTFVGDPERAGMVVSATSFGYKFGAPHDVDLLFDVRFLANPPLRSGVEGQDRPGPAVAATSRRTRRRRPSWQQLAQLPRLPPAALRARAQDYLSIGDRPHGGKHRSVYVAERLADADARSGGIPFASRTGTDRGASEIMAPLS